MARHVGDRTIALVDVHLGVELAMRRATSCRAVTRSSTRAGAATLRVLDCHWMHILYQNGRLTCSRATRRGPRRERVLPSILPRYSSPSAPSATTTTRSRSSCPPAPRDGLAIPKLVEVVRKISLELRDRLSIYSGRSLVGLHMLEGLPPARPAGAITTGAKRLTATRSPRRRDRLLSVSVDLPFYSATIGLWVSIYPVS
jgi:hypothetical protein